MLNSYGGVFESWRNLNIISAFMKPPLPSRKDITLQDLTLFTVKFDFRKSVSYSVKRENEITGQLGARRKRPSPGVVTACSGQSWGPCLWPPLALVGDMSKVTLQDS